jgi:hypothetical protein
MKGLLILNAVVMFLAAAFAVNLAVVCVLYAANLDASPQLRIDLPLLLKVTAIFSGITVVAAFTFFGQRRRARWFWPAQAALVVVVVASSLLLRSLLG